MTVLIINQNYLPESQAYNSLKCLSVRLSAQKIVSFERVHEKNYYFVFALECYVHIE